MDIFGGLTWEQHQLNKHRIGIENCKRGLKYCGMVLVILVAVWAVSNLGSFANLTVNVMEGSGSTQVVEPSNGHLVESILLAFGLIVFVVASWFLWLLCFHAMHLEKKGISPSSDLSELNFRDVVGNKEKVERYLDFLSFRLSYRSFKTKIAVVVCITMAVVFFGVTNTYSEFAKAIGVSFDDMANFILIILFCLYPGLFAMLLLSGSKVYFNVFYEHRTIPVYEVETHPRSIETLIDSVNEEYAPTNVLNASRRHLGYFLSQ